MNENYDPNSNMDVNSTPENPQVSENPPGYFTMREPTPEEQNRQKEESAYQSSQAYQSPGYQATVYQRPQEQQQYPPDGFTPPVGGTGGQREIPRYVQPPRQYSTSSGWQQEGAADQYGKPPRRKHRGLMAFGIVAGSVFAVALVAFAGIGVMNVLDTNNAMLEPSSSQSEITVPAESLPGFTLQDRPASDAALLPNGAMTTQQIVKKVEPSVVAITVYLNVSNFQASGMGSGIVMSEDGYIVTNAHVVTGAQGITVQMSNGDSFEGRLIAADTKTDLAVIKVDATGLTAATFGNSDQVEVGEKVLAIGNPQSMEFYGSVTQGIVSGLDRKIVAQDASTGIQTAYSNLIQTDAAINPGNSGGALVNEYGQVIGINSAKVIASGSEGMGFAIPSNEAKPVIDDLINAGYVTGRVRLGISAFPVNDALAQMNGVKPGLLVQSTEQNSPISQQGVIPGDIITAINGVAISSVDQLSEQLVDKKPGDQVTLSIYRPSSRSAQQARSFEVQVTLLEDKGETGQPPAQQTPPQQTPQIDPRNEQLPDELNDFFNEFFN